MTLKNILNIQISASQFPSQTFNEQLACVHLNDDNADLILVSVKPPSRIKRGKPWKTIEASSKVSPVTDTDDKPRDTLIHEAQQIRADFVNARIGPLIR